VRDNPLELPPIHIAEQGSQAILSFLRESMKGLFSFSFFFLFFFFCNKSQFQIVTNSHFEFFIFVFLGERGSANHTIAIGDGLVQGVQAKESSFNIISKNEKGGNLIFFNSINK